jgi:glutamate dehydrogenase (NAD(P)+)
MVQGFGNVGSNASTILSRYGASLIAVGDHTGYMYNPEGFNEHKLTEWVREHKGIAGYPSGKMITREEFFAMQADIFIPAALENQIGEAEAKTLNVKLVAEGANGPTSPEGEKILLDRGVTIIPDILANAGGVTVSYYEWVQNKRSESWDLEEVDSRLETQIKRVYQETVRMGRQRNVDMRIAAYGLALQRIEAVYRERDIFP